jgi:microcystin-dependent protein
MPLNKLENFIKNTDGRTLYVNPADLNATDSITNQGTSLTEPFRTIQRALIEAARFSYVRGNDNDLIERTTILIYPGDHQIDNRPGYGVRLDQSGGINEGFAVAPDGSETDLFTTFNLTGDTNFDIDDPNNILWRFNSIYGGVIVPRGVSLVGLDLRKTRIRPKYVPNPTVRSTDPSCIFRVTGTCYFWQFTFFDGNENELVYTDPVDSSINNRSTPTFSHHKLTCFEYADGVNLAPLGTNTGQFTDLEMYYYKLSNAYNNATDRPIGEKFPVDSEGFTPQRPEFEIVGAFATDPIKIVRLENGEGGNVSTINTVTTQIPHGLNVGTPIKINGVATVNFNLSTKVSQVLSDTEFQYVFEEIPNNGLIPVLPDVTNAFVTVETDTVTGASPYIFNCSLRSVWGMNGMFADGSKATGFRSMVVAQFTAISLQKDDRAFVKYNPQTRKYDQITITERRGGELPLLASSTNPATVYHLDPFAIYRPEWGTTHIKISNDAVMQIVSVFAIGFNNHFAALTGADASITNSNSNFGQFSLVADGFKNEAFDKDDQGFITDIITPQTAFNPNTDSIEEIAFVNLDFQKTADVADNRRIYLAAFTNPEVRPPSIIQGFRIGANNEETIYQRLRDENLPRLTAQVNMTSEVANETEDFIGFKSFNVVDLATTSSVLTIEPTNTPPSPTGTPHGLATGESIRILADNGDLPEGIEQDTLYYAEVVAFNQIRLATSETNAFNGVFVQIYQSSTSSANLRIESRVNDKQPGESGHPIQFDPNPLVNNWYISASPNNAIYQYMLANPTSDEGIEFISTVERKADNRALEDQIYRLRYVIPRTSTNSRPPTPGYILQESNFTGARNDDDFTIQNIGQGDYQYKRNWRFVRDAEVDPLNSDLFRYETELPHQLNVGDKVRITQVISTNNPAAVQTRGYNGEFIVEQIIDAFTFTTGRTSVSDGLFRFDPGDYANNNNQRNLLLPRFEKKDNEINLFVYRVEEIIPFQEGIRDGIYHLFCLNGGNDVSDTGAVTFDGFEYNQPIEYFYPQKDNDNLRQNPPSSRSFANRAPLGRVTIDEIQNSLTRESIDRLWLSQNAGNITGVSGNTVTFDRQHFFNAITSVTVTNNGAGYTDSPVGGRWYNVRLFNGGNDTGATCSVEIVAGVIVGEVRIESQGSAINVGDNLTPISADIGSPTTAAVFTVTADDLQDNIGTVVQFTGGGSLNPSFYSYITAIPSETQITVAESVAGRVVSGMYVVPTDSTTPVDSSEFNVDSGITTFTRAGEAYGLQRGNSFIAFDTAGAALGQYYVDLVSEDAVAGTYSITATTGSELTNVDLIGKTGFEDNSATTGVFGENIGVRGFSPYDYETFFLNADAGSGSVIRIRPENGTVATLGERLYLGRYIQVGAEIMRVANATPGGPLQDEIQVIRGSLGSIISNHRENAKVRAIKPLPYELRRPSILRASGHTFEYIGYGPGNYSVALPQLQVRQLPESEIFLVQAQELAAGQVVYTGMSDNGDFYIGNIKFSATSGTQTTFDVPVPSVAGELASSNNVVFDEVIINRRLFVAGGETKEVLSQFDGPVKFTKPVTFNDDVGFTGTIITTNLEVSSSANATSSREAPFTVTGGAGIGRDLYVAGDIYLQSNPVGDDYGTLYTNIIDTEYNPAGTEEASRNIELFYSASDPNYPIGIGSTTGKVSFKSEIPGTGEGGRDGIASSDAGVEVVGSLIVREKLIAQEFVGDGLGRPGSIIAWGGAATEAVGAPNRIPDGYLLCNGRFLSKPISEGGTVDTYARLWNAIGNIHGETATTFRIPDLRERFIVGAGGNNPGVIGDPYDVADTGGSNTVTLTEANLATHTHGISVETTNHVHTANATVQTANATHNHPATTVGTQGAHGHTVSVSNGGAHTHSGSTNNTGGHSHSYTLTLPQRGTSGGGARDGANPQGSNTGNAGSHSHSLSINSAGSEHTHNGATVGQQGGHGHQVTTTSVNAPHNHPATATVNPTTDQLHTHTIDNTGDGTEIENRPPYYALCWIIQFR